MDRYEKIGYTCLGGLAVLYILAMIIGMIAAMPLGLIGLVAFIGIGALLVKVITERIANKEDDYYSQNVKK